MHTLTNELRLTAVVTLFVLTSVATAQWNSSPLTVAWSTPPLLDSQEPSLSLIIESVKPAQDPSAAPQKHGLTRRDLSTLLSVLPAIDSWAAFRTQTAELRHHREIRDIQLLGVSPTFDSGSSFRIITGRFLSPEDHERRQNVCVMSQTLANKLGMGGDPIGSRIQIGNQYFSVVGIVEGNFEKKDAGALDLLSQDVLVPLSTMQAKMGDTVVERRQGSFEIAEYELSQIQLGLKPGVTARDLTHLVHEILKKNHPDNDYQILLVE
jgi:putative ABC transport system permease protein